MIDGRLMMTTRTFVHSVITMTVLMVAVANAARSHGQVSKALDVSRFLGSWSGDTKANESAFQAGLIPAEQGLKISTTSDALVVTTTFRRASNTGGAPWTDGYKLSYKLDGSTSLGVLNGLPATTKLAAREGDVLFLEVLRERTSERLQTMTISIEGNRLKVEWSRGQFAATLFYVRPPAR